MGLPHYELSSARHVASDHTKLDDHTELEEFDLEGGRRAEPLHIASGDDSLMSFASEEEPRVYSVIEQYEPSELPDPQPIDSARPLTPWSGAARAAAPSATLAGAVLLVAVSSGLPVGTQVLPERRTTHAQVHQESTAEARSPLTTTALASASARSPDRGHAGRPQPTSGHLSSLPTDSGRGIELDELRRAFGSLDRQDIPFEQCAVRVPAVDRVVIRCHARRGEGDLEGDSSAGPLAEWTVDFNRALDRWQVVSAPAL